MSNQVIKLTIYDPETSEVKRELVRGFIPWVMLKSVIRLSKKLNLLKLTELTDLTEEDADEITSLVVDIFGGQVTMTELYQGADMVQMLAVLQTIMSMAAQASGNPTSPAKLTQK